MLEAEAELGGLEKPVDHIEAAADPVIDELGRILGPDDEQRRRDARGDVGRELDEGLPAIIERPQRPPA